jgi:ribosomal-protein-alanine N-acetyltransferase
MEIRTERLLLREFAEDDAPAFLAYHADPRFTEFYAPEEAGPDHAWKLLGLFSQWAAERPRHNYQLAVAVLHEPRELVGCCGLRGQHLGVTKAEFGIELAPRCWGHGYATEAASAILEFGFRELALQEVQGLSVSANAPVTRLMRRLGFTIVGVRAGPEWMRARGWSQTEWQLTRERWQPSRALASRCSREV